MQSSFDTCRGVSRVCVYMQKSITCISREKEKYENININIILRGIELHVLQSTETDIEKKRNKLLVELRAYIYAKI